MHRGVRCAIRSLPVMIKPWRWGADWPGVQDPVNLAPKDSRREEASRGAMERPSFRDLWTLVRGR